MKLMLTPTSGVPSEVTTCPRMTQAWLHTKDQHGYYALYIHTQIQRNTIQKKHLALESFMKKKMWGSV